MQLLYEATILDFKLDMNTYLKFIISTSFDQEVQFDTKESIAHLYILFKNDVNPETFNFCYELLTEHFKSNYSNKQNFNDSFEKLFKKAGKAPKDSGYLKEDPLNNRIIFDDSENGKGPSGNI